MSETLFSVGIDPGWKSLGFVIVKKKNGILTRIHSESINPSLTSMFEVAEHIRETVRDLTSERTVYAQMERYVAYSGIVSADSEYILEMIGHLQYALRLAGNVSVVNMYRAIDWKQKLVKFLFATKGFDNPSTKLDKKFSMAASSCCLDIVKETGTNHEADATCLACLPLIGMADSGGNAKTIKKRGSPNAGTGDKSKGKTVATLP